MKMMITTYSKRILRCEPTAGYTQLAHAAVSFQTISPFKLFLFVSNCKMYLSQIAKCSCLKLQNVFVSNCKWICLKLQNVFVSN